MPADLTGKVALVTGGARGIGAATALRLAADGAKVAVTDLDVDGAPPELLAIACDVTQRDQVDAAFERVASELGPVDILVTCAGVTRDNLIHKLDDDDWDLVISTHLRGTFLAVQAAQGQMVPRKTGSMVLISSTSALGNRGQTNYAAAKAGIQGMTKTLAMELGRYGITVNCVAPGFVETRMTQAIAERTGRDWQEIKTELAADIPLGRIGQPEDIASAIAFLAGDGASWISGQVLYVRGGP
jgi:3-oxoacyl-[acyl-carrier protein] reductase